MQVRVLVPDAIEGVVSPTEAVALFSEVRSSGAVSSAEASVYSYAWELELGGSDISFTEGSDDLLTGATSPPPFRRFN